ncbi:50S ribosomal protein L6 [Rhodoferax sp. 4810]|uniref:Large ribosomal subunit protein uL6 n=1 Tax=Thiospirillum jenense TaxID=1653858 RepID=A0A839HD51_9GAMM|nr:50S ribosomal protein L6 [Thiospirillum jenense]MBB1073011.1 50S ribosomal protein L6 [Rhodoferax jenense]MBB1124959.1 50S ribosomal protein L6 [Thiospirillum jenense]
MSRIAKAPIPIPSGVSVNIQGQKIAVTGNKGCLAWLIHPLVRVALEDNHLKIAPLDQERQLAWALAGTTRALINNLVIGVSQGFERRLTLVGVGYRAQVKGKVLNLSLGFSHPVDYEIPEGIEIETPSQTEIVIRGADKQQVGQVSAKIRSYRPPEPYKGKGVRYSNEQVLRKETKKK